MTTAHSSILAPEGEKMLRAIEKMHSLEQFLFLNAQVSSELRSIGRKPFVINNIPDNEQQQEKKGSSWSSR